MPFAKSTKDKLDLGLFKVGFRESCGGGSSVRTVNTGVPQSGDPLAELES